MSSRRDIDSILDDVVTLPSLPTTVARIAEMVNDPACSLKEVGQAVSTDPAIALKTLRLANSAYYGLRQKVTSVEQAVVLLGLKVIKNMVFTAAVFETLRTDMNQFLQHSVAAGMAMRVLVETRGGDAGLSSPDEAFVYGLLHDVGKIIFEQFFPEDFQRIADAAQRDGTPWHEAERAILGADHAQMGARLARNWKLPEELAQAIGGHHDLNETHPQHAQLAALLSVADFIAWSSGFGAHPHQVVTVSEAHWAAAGLPAQDVPAVMERYFEAVTHMGDLLTAAAPA